MLRIAISFDYDSPAGYRQSFHMRDFPANADYEGTEILLKVLREHNVKATFGIVGRAALPGKRWEHCPEQVREIQHEGHEVASHSMTHRYLPSMRDDDLMDELAASKSALEECTGTRVKGFIPPFNRPCHFPEYGSYSLSEVLGLDGRGRGRQGIANMLRMLKRAGFAWSRVSFENKFHRIGRKLGVVEKQQPRQPFVFENMVAIPLHHTGFGNSTRASIRRWIGHDLTLAIYGHPNQALSANDQNADELHGLLSNFREAREKGEVTFHTMAGVAALALGERMELPREVFV